MGLAALRRLLDPHPVNVDSLSGRHLAVDANNQLWTFVTGLGARGEPPRGPEGQDISHILGLVNRLKWYYDRGITSAWVFDGEQPKLKEATIQERKEKLAKTGGPKLEWEQIQESMELLTALGIPTIQAPYESDPQCAQLVREGVVDGAVTQDYDAALHDCPITYRNLTGGKRPCERMDLALSLETAGITREQLVDLAILIGTDYNDGIKGVGPVKALKAIKTHGDLHSALAGLGHEMPEADDVRALFLEHKVDVGLDVTPTAPDETLVRELLQHHGISKRRQNALLQSLHRAGGI